MKGLFRVHFIGKGASVPSVSKKWLISITSNMKYCRDMSQSMDGFVRAGRPALAQSIKEAWLEQLNEPGTLPYFLLSLTEHPGAEHGQEA
jgi:hypothetical protein